MTTPIKCVVDASVCIKQFILDPLSTKAQLLFAHLANPQNQIYIADIGSQIPGSFVTHYKQGHW